MEGCSCDLVCMAVLGNMAGSNEGICRPRAGNVGLYQGVRPTVVLHGFYIINMFTTNQ